MPKPPPPKFPARNVKSTDIVTKVRAKEINRVISEVGYQYSRSKEAVKAEARRKIAVPTIIIPVCAPNPINIKKMIGYKVGNNKDINTVRQGRKTINS